MLRVTSCAVLVVLLSGLNAGCEQIVDALRNAEVRTVTLEPVKTAVRQHTTWANFGICHDRLERRVVGSRLGGVFDRRDDPTLEGLAGYDVGVARGESCHLRETNEFQTAVQFDLSTLPAGEITRAELRMRSVSDYGTDPPIRTGTTTQCNVLTLGRATASWDPVPEQAFDLVPWTAVTRRPAGFGWGVPIGPFVVTPTVESWVAGDTPNLGFVITPDHGQVTLQAAAVGDVGDQFMCGVMTADYELVVTVLARRT